ncbi:ABC transporter substrate-binding protein [Methanoculleus sp. FWC-SCC1]|uniref:ABC transporter substrate-binding protein n=1 Tax=Methanoculleus frigidifontis TaxID=2584085 RepID=A0ABT8M8G5_9EURY|nr:ABC transporter substrate-binding protein [Methanoculleus sp. FWC-SCC1]MDN7024220.1 ABC transporter substrate-binding protein [Methanoculleus sp. FWC-SCC1]
MRRIISLCMAAVVVVALVLASGCTGTGGDTQQVTTLRIGYQPSTHQIAEMTAMEKGWWQEDLASYGVTTVTDTEFPTGAPEMQAMIADQIDIAYVGAAPAIVAMANSGLDAKIVAAVQTQGSNLVLQPEIAYAGPADLKGLKIATFPPGTIQDTLLKNWLLENNLTPDVDVTIVAMGPGDAMTAIAADQVDGVFLPHPAPAIIESNNNGRSVVASGEMQPNHACCVLLVSGKLIREQPDLVTEIVKTHVRATDYSLANKDEAATTYAAKTGQDVAIVKKSFAEWDGTWVYDPNLITDSVVSYTQIQYDLGYVNKPLTKDEIFDLSFYEKATA